MIITAGKYKGVKITAPDENITRPTLSKVRMAVFNTLQSFMDFEGASFLDMYAGSGIMGLEALSRGFSSVTAIEKNPKVLRILKENYKKVKVEASILSGDSLKTVLKLNKKFNVIYIDPPYNAGINEKSLQAVKGIADGIIILEHTSDVVFDGLRVIKQKNYGDKILTFFN